MRKSAVIVMIMIVFNLVLIWFGAMGFFDYHPTGIETGLSSNITLGNLLLLIMFLVGVGWVVAKLTNINVFGMILYMEIFWVPFMTTLDTFNRMFTGAPAAFLGFSSIFFIICSFVFAYDIYEMSGDVAT